MSYLVPVLAYHKVDSKKELGITSISPSKFEKHIKFLKQSGYNIIPPQSLFDQISDKSVLITFDDGYEGIYKYAYPIIKKYDSTAIIFLTTGYIGNYNKWDASPGPRFKHLNWQQVKEMSDNGIYFGSHGVRHLFLTKHKDKDIEYELKASKEVIEDNIEKPVIFFSYPYGDCNKKVFDLVKKAGYESAFSLRPEFFSNKCRNYNYNLPRIAIYCIDSMMDFRAKLGETKRLLIYMQRLKNRIINRCSYAGLIFERFKL
ncbi:MAG: polysaccharide deacetylase family protein [Candidatus Poribacteria bacterium]